MDEQPENQQTERRQAKRRWFRFRLSTVLILTAIVAWGMACGPWWGPQDQRRIVVDARPNWQENLLRPGERFTAAELRHSPAGEIVRVDIARYAINPRFKWLLVVLAAFLTWKAAWAVVERRRRRSAAPE